jgi:aconitate hydratase
MDVDLASEPLGFAKDGRPVFLRDVWPAPEEIRRAIADFVKPEMFRERYARAFEGPAEWRRVQAPSSLRYAWDAGSTYVRKPPFFDGLTRAPAPLQDVRGARALALLGDSVTTDHISPAGSIAKGGPAAQYLVEHGVEPADFNSYGARRGNHEVMVRGTFANIRLRNRLAPGTEGGLTTCFLDGQVTSIYDAAVRYAAAGVPLVVLAGKEYGTGSSRDWAAKGTKLLGVRAVIAESFERIHRSNLVGMGVLPLQFAAGTSAASLGLSGRERYDVTGIASVATGGTLVVRATDDAGAVREFETRVRIDTPNELEYYRHGGIMPFVLRQLASR